MKQTFLFYSFLACVLVFTLASCGKDNGNGAPSAQTDTVWTQQPYDTAAARDGRVWRSESHWIVWNNAQPQLCGYSVTLTHLDDSSFRSEVFVTEGPVYVRFFQDGTAYRYRLIPTSDNDTLLLALPADSPESFDPTSDDAFLFRRLTDSWVRLQCVFGLADEGIELFDFKRIQN